MGLDSITFDKILWENESFSLCRVRTAHTSISYIALIPTCLKLKKILPSIPSTIQSLSAEMNEALGEIACFSKLVESGITPECSPFLVVEQPAGVPLSEYAFVARDEFLYVVRELATALNTLHEAGLFQREISPHFDVYFDGEKVFVPFPAARDIFHKSYLGAGSNATVFDIPRFVIFPGSVYEDVQSLLHVLIDILTTHMDIPALDPKMLCLDYFTELKIQIAESKANAAGVLKALMVLTEEFLENSKKDSVNTFVSSPFDEMSEGEAASDPSINKRVTHEGAEIKKLFDTIPVAEAYEALSQRRQFSERGVYILFRRVCDYLFSSKARASINRMGSFVPKPYKKIFILSIGITCLFAFVISFILPKNEINNNKGSEIIDQSYVDLKTKAESSKKEIVHSAELQAPKEAVTEEVPLLDPNWRDDESEEVHFDDRAQGVPEKFQKKEDRVDSELPEEREVIETQVVNTLRDKNEPRKDDNSVVKAEETHESSVSKDLVTLVKSPRFEDRINAAKMIKKECADKKERMIPYIQILLVDADILVRGFAVHTYASCLGVEAKKELLNRYKLEESSVVKREIEKVLKGL